MKRPGVRLSGERTRGDFVHRRFSLRFTGNEKTSKMIGRKQGKESREKKAGVKRMDGRSTGNYEKQVYFARDLFLRYDQDAMIRKFDLTSDGQFLYCLLYTSRCV